MGIKTFFFSKSNLTQIIINKYASQKFYNKNYITKLFFNKWKSFIEVDLYSTKILVLSKAYKSLFLLKLIKRGSSLILDDFIYKNSKLHGYLYSGLGLKSKVTDFTTNLWKRLNFWETQIVSFLLYKIKRGGYLGLSNGIKGFIPFKHLLFYTRPFKVYKTCILLYDTCTTNIITNHIYNIKINFGGFNFNFNRANRKRRRLFLGGKLHFFFLSYLTLIKMWLDQFKFSSFTIRQIKLVFKLLFKTFLKKLRPNLFSDKRIKF